MIIEHLTWDSNFFSKKIGKINYLSTRLTELDYLLTKAKEQEYQLIYVISDKDLYFDQLFLDKHQGKLVDRKVVYSQSKLSIKSTKFASEYKSFEITYELETLAYLSGIYSRFRTDNNFAQQDFYRLYKTWITKSISKEIADKIFIIEDLDEIVGMATLKFKKTNSEIGLIAVSEKSQGKKYGRDLIDTCTNATLSKGLSQIEVTTQIENIAACRFYEKCGYSVKSIINIYHFWL